MAGDVTRERLHSLPKAELHVHLDGSLRPETMVELAQEQGIDLPTRDPTALAESLLAANSRDLEDYLKKFAIPLSILQTPEALERVAYELALDAAEENVRYIEVRYSPALHTGRAMSFQEAVDAVLLGLRKAEADVPILTGLIVCGIRSMDPGVSMELAELAVANMQDGVVAFDLAGAEGGNPAEAHSAAFQHAAQNNLAITVHAGEGDGPQSIREALQACHARRIGHGTRLLEDQALEAFVRDFQIPLEVCLSSNVQTHVAPSFREHPFRRYFDAGLVVTLNTDSRLISGTSLTREYWLAHQHLGLGWNDLMAVAVMGFQAAFLPFPAKLNLLEEVMGEMARLDGDELS